MVRAMELNATHHRVLSAVEAATSGGEAATDGEIAACLMEPISGDLRDVLTQLEREPERPLVEFATEVAQYYRPPHPPPMGEHRWQLTEDGREVLRSTEPPA